MVDHTIILPTTNNTLELHRRASGNGSGIYPGSTVYGSAMFTMNQSLALSEAEGQLQPIAHATNKHRSIGKFGMFGMFEQSLALSLPKG